MKKLILGLMVATLIVALSLSVMATEPASLDDEHPAWELTDGGWISMGGLQAKARAWSSDKVIEGCNKTDWVIPVSVHASVAQWIEFSITGTRYVWRVRKPGTYAANSLSAILASNGDVGIAFNGFADLVGDKGGTIPIWYAEGDVHGPGDIPYWIRAENLNGEYSLVDTELLHDGYTWKLWNKIEVVECNSACEYQDDAIITLVLKNQKPWIDPDTGYFAAD